MANFQKQCDEGKIAEEEVAGILREKTGLNVERFQHPSEFTKRTLTPEQKRLETMGTG